MAIWWWNFAVCSRWERFYNARKLTDGAVSVEVAARSMRPLGARGVIYKVPSDISTDDLVACLQFKGLNLWNVFVSKVVILLSWRILNLFFCSLLLLTSLVRRKLVTCFSAWNGMFRDHYGVFKCNRYGHVAGHCRGKLHSEHKHSECSAVAPKCPNCGGDHSANDKICPRHKRDTETLKLKTEAKLSYADACKACRILPFRIWFHNLLFPLFQKRQ